jgi:hypothetical protein
MRAILLIPTIQMYAVALDQSGLEPQHLVVLQRLVVHLGLVTALELMTQLLLIVEVALLVAANLCLVVVSVGAEILVLVLVYSVDSVNLLQVVPCSVGGKHLQVVIHSEPPTIFPILVPSSEARRILLTGTRLPLEEGYLQPTIPDRPMAKREQILGAVYSVSQMQHLARQQEAREVGALLLFKPPMEISNA